MKQHPRDRQASRTMLLTTLALLVLSAPSPTLADGGLISIYGSDIWEPSQKALLLWDPDAEREELIIQVDFFGETRDFGWIVPVPSLPELAAMSGMVFDDLFMLTRPLYRDRGGGWGCFGSDRNGVMAPEQGSEDGITIYGEETVGIYRTITLGAENAEPLVDSLQAWGYLHDLNRSKVEEALDFYIEKSWYFVAMKVDSTSVTYRNHDDYWYGGLNPIRFAFDTPELVYPLRISAISARDPSLVLLYVCAPRRMDYPGARTDYANELNDEEFGYIQEAYRYLGPLLRQPCFITMLRKSFLAEEMDDDLILQPAATNDEYRRIYDYGSLPGEPLLLAMTALFLLGWAGAKRRRRRPRSRQV